MTEYQELLCAIKSTGKQDAQTLSDMFDVCRMIGSSADGDVKRIYRTAVANISLSAAQNAPAYYELAHKAAIYLGKRWFEYFLYALEWNREPSKKFYMPRRRVLNKVVAALQELADRKIEFLGISLPPRVGKSTLCIFFLAWMMGKNPDTANVMSGHSDKLTNAFYREMLAIFQDRETYAYYDVFPEIHIAEVSAKNETINLNRQKRFASLTCRSVGGTLTGAVEIGEDGLLYCDDLVEDLEEALNPQRLEAKYNAYLNQLKDRKKDGARELMVGTRWNVLDPIGRIQEQYKNSPLYKFLVIPAVDELGQSNFMYDYGVGFSTEYYTDMKNSIDDATWNAKYMGAPYVREGLLFPADGLKYYDGTLPDGEPDKILAACDVAWGGGDSLSMPVCYVYGQDAYIADVVFNRGNKDITRPIVIGKLKKHRPHQVEFEANNGGDEYAGIVSDHLKKENVIINITSRKAPTKTSKLARIVQVAPEIKNLFFLQEQYRDGEYRAFMQELTTFVISGVNPHDDAPDSLAMLVNMIFYGIAAVEPVARPF